MIGSEIVFKNGGDTTMVFTTVEFKDISPNDPLPVDDRFRTDG